MPKEAYDFNIKLVKTVEQHPSLYNYQLPEYSRRDVVSAAWEKVAQEMYQTAQECKDTWRTLRVIYTRSIKLPPSGTAAKKLSQKTKDMIKEMDFIRPYVNAKNSQELPSNLPPLPSPDEEDDNLRETPETEDIESVRNATDNEESVGTTPQLTKHVQPPAKRKKKQQSYRDSEDGIDACVMDYIKRKQQPEPENPKRLFLLSLLPDLEQMDDKQMRRFRNKVCGLIDEILNIEDGESNKKASASSTSVSGQTEHSQASASSNLTQQTSVQRWFGNKETNLQTGNFEWNAGYDPVWYNNNLQHLLTNL